MDFNEVALLCEVQICAELNFPKRIGVGFDVEKSLSFVKKKVIVLSDT